MQASSQRRVPEQATYEVHRIASSQGRGDLWSEFAVVDLQIPSSRLGNDPNPGTRFAHA